MLYQLLIRLLSPIIWLLIVKDALKLSDGRAFLQQRLGLRYPTLPASPKRLWFHCVSVGEVKAAEPLIRALQTQHDILITTNTPTGKQLVDSLFFSQPNNAQSSHNQAFTHCYLPLDWPFAIRRFLQACRPTHLWVLETEIWPNLYRISHQNGIDIRIVNGRISRKTLQSPQWLKSVYRQSLQHVNQVLARSKADADRFIAMGTPPEKITVVGNLKYAQILTMPNQPNPIGRAYILLASSHADEEQEISLRWLKHKRPLLLVIVPRHPKRSAAIQKQLRLLSSQLAVASQLDPIDDNTRLFLDDRLGQLLPLFQHAELVIMGGSFVPKGGHNILEPAAYQKAIITGPDMSDFDDETQLLKRNNGIIQCQNYQELDRIISELLDNPEQRNALGQGAKNAIQSQTNLLSTYLDHLLTTP